MNLEGKKPFQVLFLQQLSKSVESESINNVSYDCQLT